jgi:signal transduction histidine kinase
VDGAQSASGNNGLVTQRTAGAIGVQQAVPRARRAIDWLFAGEPRTKPGLPGLLLDAVLACVVTISVLVWVGKTHGCAVIAPFSQCVGPFPAPPGPVHHLPVLLATAMTAAPLALRRIRPLAAFWVIVAAVIIVPAEADNIFTMLAIVVAAYSAAVHSRYRRLAMVSVPVAGILVATAFPSVAQPLTLPNQATAFLALIPVVILAQAVHRWRSRAGASQERLVQLQRAHEAATRRVLANERARIASDLHDVVTHNVSVMIVQAGAARQVLDGAPADARAALLAVEASGRAAMEELRNLLGLLSPVTGAASSEPDAIAAAELQPQPGLRQLGALIDRVRSAGLDVESQQGSLPPDLPPGQDLTAYRVVQEALTNVIKHAGRTSATVRVECEAGTLIVSVADAGPAGSGPGPDVPGAGRGLLGLRERTALYGGELSAGPAPDGGWLVCARLPVGAGPGGIARKAVPAA